MAVVTIGSDEWLSEVVGGRSFQAFTAVVRDSDQAMLSAVITWPDGTSGQFTADTVSSTSPGLVDAFHITYPGDVAKTVTQPAVTRDATGAITNQPLLVIT